MAIEREHDESGALSLPGEGPLIVLPDAAVTASPRLARTIAGPALVPWLALWLAREGLSVLVHGPGASQGGGGAAEVLHSLGICPASDAGHVTDRWARREPAVVATSALAAGRLPAGVQWQLMAPQGLRPCLRVLPCNAPGSARSAADWAARSGAAVLLLVGAPITDPHHGPQAEVWIGGQFRADLAAPAPDESPAGWTPLPHDTGAAATALFVQELLSGVRPTPQPLRRLAGLVERTAWATVTPSDAHAPVSCL
ncbi:MAG: hypothetical protein ING89_06840 [Rubrivivax sp.]|jgi:hypothetical protein|nr:hypothetical protein [Rubrivivax sp.]